MKLNCVWLICALILSAAVPAWADSLTTQASVQLPNASITNTGPCFGGAGCLSPDIATATLANFSGSGSASASASFGAVDAASSIAQTGVASFGESASTSASFIDSLTVLSGSGLGTFQIAFVTTGATASASGNGDATTTLLMQVGIGSFAHPLSATYQVLDDSVHGGLTITGLPITVFTIDASAGETIFFSADLSANSNVFSVGSTASAADPTSLFITPPAGFTYTTASGTTYSPPTSSVPEPSSLLLLGPGLACLGAWGRKMLKRI